MKNLLSLLALTLLSTSQPASASGRANVREFVRLTRTYTGLDKLDLSSCKRSYRFLNRNWMDCEEQITSPNAHLTLNQITPAHFPIVAYELPTAMDGIILRVDIRTTGSTMEELSLATKTHITAYYQKIGGNRIEELPGENYSYEKFQTAVRTALVKASKEEAFHTESPFIAVAAGENSLARDKVIGSLFLVRRAIPLSVNACKDSFASRLVDRWPDENEWVTECEVRGNPDQEPLPLSANYWSARLQPAAETVVSLNGMTLGFTPVGYGLSADGQVAWEDFGKTAAALLASLKHSVTAYFIVDEADLAKLPAGDVVLGKLVLRNGKMDIL